MIKYTQFIFALYIYTICTIYFLLYLLLFRVCIIYISYSIYNISIFFIFYVSFLRTIFLNQCVSLFIDKRVVLPLLLHDLIFSCHMSQDGDLAGDCITREMKVYA